MDYFKYDDHSVLKQIVEDGENEDLTVEEVMNKYKRAVVLQCLVFQVNQIVL